MNHDALGIVVGPLIIIGFLLFLGTAAWWWRQRLRFASGANPVLACELRRPARWGFGWRSGTLKLTDDTMLWRGYWSFRATPKVVLRRHDLSFFSRTRASLLHVQHQPESGDLSHAGISPGVYHVIAYRDVSDPTTSAGGYTVRSLRVDAGLHVPFPCPGNG